MKTMYKLFAFIIIFSNLNVNAQNNSSEIQIKKEGSFSQLLIKGQPYLILGGELGNSSASSIEYLQPHWEHLKQMNLNTILVPVYWELMEPIENKFDFSLIDKIIQESKQQGLKVVLLWFGTWKNSMSSYAPLWMKTNTTRFPRTYDSLKRSQEIFSVFGKETLAADKKAFVNLLQHIKETDVSKTVIMVQVENEIGMLPTAREFSKVADNEFMANVPKSLITYLEKNKNSLAPALASKLGKNGFAINENWENTFGKDLATDEIFQAWHYAKYANEIALAGKAIYDIPMFVNAALPRAGKLPGQYPSAGPLPHLMDIWHAAAPAIDMLSPDFYNPETKYWCDLYTRNGNTLFVPEIQFDKLAAVKAFFVIGHYKALGYSPFSIESVNEASNDLMKTYDILHQLSPLIVNKKWIEMEGFFLDKKNKIQTLKMGNYVLSVSHQAMLSWSPEANDSVWSTTGGIILQTGVDEFLIAGTGFVINFKNIDTNLVSNIATSDELKIINGIDVKSRKLNGDQTHQGRHIEFGIGNWGIQKLNLYNSPSKIE